MKEPMTIRTLAEELGHPSQDVNILRGEWVSCRACKGLWPFKYFRDNNPKCFEVKYADERIC